MRKPWKYGINALIGLIAGFVLYQFIVFEGYTYLTAIHGISGLEESAIGITGFKFIGFIVLILTYVFFNTGRMNKVNFNRISIYLILSVIGALVAALEFMFLSGRTVTYLAPDLEQYVQNNSFLFTNLAFIFIIAVILVFLGVFWILVNRKVRYINFLTKEVKEIKNKGFGKTIEVRGRDELAELCGSINDMSVELGRKIDNERKIEENKNELITNVSHDLRTPLTSIMGYVDLIKNMSHEDGERFREYVDIIDKKSKSLNKLINELFEYTKLNSHDIKLNYSEVDLGSLLEQLAGEYMVMFKRQTLELQCNIPSEDIVIQADVGKIVRAIENLFINAGKYSIRNTTVSLNLQRQDGYAVISLANKTESISDSEINNLFERFYKADKSRKKSDSTGLGLSIVKRIVELHGGRAEAALNNGIIEFKVKLPINN